MNLSLVSKRTEETVVSATVFTRLETGQMTDIDFAAKKEANSKWVLPESLHLPVAARDKASIVKYIGDIVSDLSGSIPNTA